MTYSVHTIESAPEGAKGLLETAQKSFGFVPNLLGVMAEAPAVLKGYRTLSAIFRETSFTETERQVVMLTVSRENGCGYCIGAHSLASEKRKVPGEIVEAARSGTAIQDPKLEALRRFTLSVVQTRGWPPESEMAAFFAAGYGQAQVLEVVLGVALKTLPNYINHIVSTPVDPAFAEAAKAKVA